MRTSRAARVYIVIAVTLAYVGNAAAQSGTWFAPYLSLDLNKPTKGTIEAFLHGGIKFGGSYSFQTDGLANHWKPELGGDEYSHCWCEKPTRYTLDHGSIRFSCQFKCMRRPPRLSGQPEKVLSNGPKAVLLRVVAVSETAMAFRDQDDDRWLVHRCAPNAQLPEGITRSCASRTNDPAAFWLEVLPAASDRKLFVAVQERLLKWPQPYSCSDHGFDSCQAAIFEGPPAKNARLYSEVFYVGVSPDAKARAQEVSELLAPIIGRITLKQWPGSWPFDVVLVVGEKSMPVTGAKPSPPSAPGSTGSPPSQDTP